jgi:hypothetical protein
MAKRTTSVYKVELDDMFEQMSAIIKRGAVTECLRCGNTFDIISFGLVSPYDAVTHVDETFYWCFCGYKWIVETEEVE